MAFSVSFLVRNASILAGSRWDGQRQLLLLRLQLGVLGLQVGELAG